MKTRMRKLLVHLHMRKITTRMVMLAISAVMTLASVIAIAGALADSSLSPFPFGKEDDGFSVEVIRQEPGWAADGSRVASGGGTLSSPDDDGTGAPDTIEEGAPANDLGAGDGTGHAEQSGEEQSGEEQQDREEASAAEGDEDQEPVDPENFHREFDYKDDTVSIVASVDEVGVVPDEAEFFCVPVDPKSDEYCELLKKAAEHYGTTEDRIEIYPYDMGFALGDEEVEPEYGEVSVQFDFKKPIEVSESESVDVLHITGDDETKVVAESVGESGQVESVEVELGKFSPVVLAKTNVGSSPLKSTQMTDDQGNEYYISKTPNIDVNGVATGYYSNSMNTTDTIPLYGSVEASVEIQYCTESTSWDWLYIKDSNGNILLQDADGKQVGDSSGKIGGGGSNSLVPKSTVQYRFEQDELQFVWRTDSSVTSYGYYAVITPTYVTSPIPAYHFEELEDGTYALVFDQGGSIEAFANRPDIREAIAPYRNHISEIRLHKDTTAVDQGAFKNLTSLKKVTIPRNSQLGTIGRGAFSGCDNLESFSIPASVTSISGSAFTGCVSLESVSFAQGSPLTELPNGLFKGLKSLSDVTLPVELTGISNDLFDGCSSLREIDIPSGVTRIGNNAFRGTRLPEVPSLANVTEIGEQAFANNPELTSVTIPATVTSLGDAFRGCSGITDFVFANGASFPVLHDGFFYGMSKLKNVTLPSDLTKIGTEMFSGCSALEHVDFPATVTSIGESAFYGCKKLQDFEIPRGVTTIGTNAFYDCDALKDMVIPNTVTSVGSQMFYGCDNLLRCQFEDGSPINSLPSGMFYGCSKLESVKLPDGVTSIPASYFRGCTSLRHVDLPRNLTSIGDYAFSGCYLLEDPVFPNTLSTIGQQAFYDCDSIANITIPNSVTSIGSYAFQACNSLATFVWADGSPMKSLPISMLDACPELETLVLPSQVTSIPNYFVRGCSKLSHVTLPSSVKSIGQEAFKGCTSLGDINIPSGCTTISAYAFQNSGLTHVDLPESLTTIGQYAFCNTQLGSVTIPVSVSSISQYAFSAITPLEAVTFAEGGVSTKVGDYAFQGNPRLRVVDTNGRVSQIGAYAFQGNPRLSEYTVDSSVTEVKDHAFNQDIGLRKLVIAASPTGTALQVDNSNAGYAFGNLTSLEELIVNRDLTSTSTNSNNSSFRNINPNVHITIGKQVDNLDNMLVSIFTHDTEITFEGENDFQVTDRIDNASADPKWSTLSGSFYVDEQGVLYKLDDASGTASLFYIPKGITSYTVPSTVTSVAGNTYSVTHVSSYACSSAEDLNSLTFENPSAVTIPQFAFSQCSSLRTINGQTELYPDDWIDVSLLCDFPVHTDLVPEQVLVLSDKMEFGGDTGTFSFGVSISNQERMGAPDDKTYVYPTGRSARLDVGISNESNVDMSDRVIRVYLAFTGDHYTLGNYPPGDYTLVNTATGSRYPFKVRETDARGVYYYDITGFKPGDTIAFNNQFNYESPKTAGGEMRIWVESLSAEQAAEREGKTSQPSKYILADWYTVPVPYRLTKSVKGNPQFQFVANQTNENDDNIYVKNLQYSINLTSTGESGTSYAKDYIKYIDMEDELQLNENLTWNPAVIEAIRNQDYYYNSSNSRLFVKIDGKWVELVRLQFPSSSYVRSVFPKVVTDDGGKTGVNICWSYRNQYWTNSSSAPTADFPASEFSIYIGEQSVQVSQGSDLWRMFREGAEFPTEESEAMRQIANKVNETSHYSYSADQYLDAVTPSRPIYKMTDFLMSKTMTGASSFGRKHAYDINLINNGLVHKDDIDLVSDPLNTHYYIKATDLESMLDDEQWGAFCKVDIASVTLCALPNKHAVDVYGEEFTITDAQYSGIDDIPYNGASPAGTDLSETVTNAKLSIHWNEDRSHKILEVKDDNGTTQQSYTIGESGCDYHTIEEALKAIGFVVVFRTEYTVNWDLGDSYTLYQAHKDGVDVASVDDLSESQRLKYEYRLKSGRTDTFHIPSSVKRTDMFLVADEPGHYPGSSAISSSNTAYAKDDTGRQVSIANWTGSISRELYLDKTASANGQTFDNNEILIPDDTTIDYTLSFSNSGDRYDVLPLTDQMGGTQVLLVPVRTNRNALYYADGATDGIPLQDANFDTYMSGGVQYYVLDKTGSYKDVIIDGRVTDTVKVTKRAGSATTLLIWYYQDVDGYVNSSTQTTSKSITYKALADSSRFAYHGVDENGSTVTNNPLSNFTWLGGHQTHRLVDSLYGESEMLQFVKDIVENPESQHEHLIKHSLIQDGDEVLYKITIQNTGKTSAVITGNRLRDELPNTSGLFEWSKDNILDITYVTENLGSSVETVGRDDWYVNAIEPGSGANTAERGKWFIRWKNSFKLNMEAGGEVWIYIKLKFPASTDLDDYGNPTNTWDNFIARNNGGRLTNDFYIDQRMSEVTHELVDIVEGTLQKGVLDTGLASSGKFQSEDTRHYYQNGSNVDNGTIQEVAYYTTVYNSGNVRLYLDNLQDDLPKGFKFRGLFNRISKNVETDKIINTSTSVSYYNDMGSYYNGYNTLRRTEYSASNSSYLPVATVADSNREQIVYKNVRVAASTSSVGDHQHIVFTISRDTNDNSLLSYDSELGKYYLNPGEAIRFGYLCAVEGYSRTENIANNEITMPVYDKYGLGVHKSNPEQVQVNPATYRDIAPNDGDCDLMTTEEEVSGHGHTKPDWTKSTTDWLSSNVSLQRLSPVPGLLKTIGGETYLEPGQTIKPNGIYGSRYTDGNKVGNAYVGTIQRTSIANWKLRIYNEGGIGSNAMENYTIVDTVDCPYRFTGNFFYDYYSTNGTKLTSSSIPLFSLGGRAEGDQTVKISTGSGSNAMTLNSTITINGDPVTVDVPGNDGIGRVTVQLLRDDDGNETIIIRLVDNYHRLPPNTYMELIAHTQYVSSDAVLSDQFYNHAQLEPSVEFDPATVAQGHVLYRMEDGEPVPYAIESGASVTMTAGYSSAARKQVTEMGATSNTGWSDRVKNSIILPGKFSKFYYDLYVDLPEDEPTQKLVLIDALPELHDHSPFVARDMRESEFKVRIFGSDPGFTVWAAPRVGSSQRTPLSYDQFTLEVTTRHEFEAADWEGGGTEWTPVNLSDGISTEEQSLLALARAFRIVIFDENLLANPSAAIMGPDYQVQVRFNGEIETPAEADPGEIAWNSFGYRYTVPVGTTGQVVSLNAEPLKVGVQVPAVPYAIKDQKTPHNHYKPIDASTEYRFLIYSGTSIASLNDISEMGPSEIYSILGENGRDFTIASVIVGGGTATGQTDYLDEQKKWALSTETGSFVATSDDWIWVPSAKYTILELPWEANGFSFSDIQHSPVNNYTFTQNEENNVAIRVTNVWAETGNLTLRKTVDGPNFNPERRFTFTISLRDGRYPAYGTYDYTGINMRDGSLTFDDTGTASIQLKHGQGITLTGLPVGYTYQITESDDEWYTQSGVTNASGTIAPDTTIESSFTNTRKSSELSVTKTVTGNMGDKGKRFDFEVYVTDEGRELNGSYPIVIHRSDGTDEQVTDPFVDGAIVVHLAHGDVAQFTGMPFGAHYEVDELAASRKGYRTTSTGESGFLGTNASTSEWTNTKGGMVPTLRDFRMPDAMFVIYLVSTAAAFVLIGKRRRIVSRKEASPPSSPCPQADSPDDGGQREEGQGETGND